MTFAETIYALLRSYWYNRDESYMIIICDRLLEGLPSGNRVWHAEDNTTDLSDDMDILWGTLVCGFGDYGTSPRYGWIRDIDIQPALTVIKEFKEECERQCSESEE